MENKFKLGIKDPCYENFDNFKPTKNGGYCSSCKKEVIDFSKMDSHEIIKFFNNKTQLTCGRFKAHQLKTYSYSTSHKKKSNLISGICLAILSLFSFNAVKAQTNITEKKPTESSTQNIGIAFQVKGIVTEDNYPLPGAIVTLKGTTIGTETDFNGYFEFPEPLKDGDILVFSYLGMESQEVIVKNKNLKTTIELKITMDSSFGMLMGNVSIKKLYKSK